MEAAQPRLLRLAVSPNADPSTGLAATAGLSICTFIRMLHSIPRVMRSG